MNDDLPIELLLACLFVVELAACWEVVESWVRTYL